MSSNNIQIESSYQEVLDTLNIEALTNTHTDLNLGKSVFYHIISDDELLEVNIKHLQHDYYTDIITFDYSNDEDIEEHEVLISWPRVQENASTHGETVYRELHRVCIHGLLHLAGHRDDTTEAKQKMRSLENRFLDLHCST